METRHPEPTLDAAPQDDDVQRPDYAAACDFLAVPFGVGLALAMLVLLPTSEPARRLAPYFVTISALCLSFIGWSFAARAFEQRRGMDGRTVPAILRDAFLKIAAPISIGAVALWLTNSVLLAYGTTLILVVVGIALARLRRAHA